MSKFLVSTTEIYRVDSESEVQEMIEEAKGDNHFSLTKYNCEHKEKMAKGELLDEYYKLTLVKHFTDEKNPDTKFTISYTSDDEVF